MAWRPSHLMTDSSVLVASEGISASSPICRSACLSKEPTRTTASAKEQRPSRASTWRRAGELRKDGTRQRGAASNRSASHWEPLTQDTLEPLKRSVCTIRRAHSSGEPSVYRRCADDPHLGQGPLHRCLRVVRLGIPRPPKLSFPEGIAKTHTLFRPPEDALNMVRAAENPCFQFRLNDDWTSPRRHSDHSEPMAQGFLGFLRCIAGHAIPCLIEHHNGVRCFVTKWLEKLGPIVKTARIPEDMNRHTISNLANAKRVRTTEQSRDGSLHVAIANEAEEIYHPKIPLASSVPKSTESNQSFSNGWSLAGTICVAPS